MNRLFSTLLGLLFLAVSAQAHENHVSTLDGQSVTITGVAQVVQSDDFRKKKSERFYYLIDSDTDKRYLVHFDKKVPKHFKTDRIITITGKLSGDSDLFLNSEEADVASRNGTDSTSANTTTTALAIGTQQTLVFQLQFPNSGAVGDAATVGAVVFGAYPSASVHSVYYESSFQKVGFAGQVVGPFTLSGTAGSCDYYGWGSQADTAAKAAGINVASYNRKVYIMPPGSGCGWAGMGTIGGSPSQTWVQEGYWANASLYAHELGHNLRLHHASTYGNEYGDDTDFMGANWGLPHVNGASKALLGWTPSTQVAVATQGGNFDIEMLETPASNIQTVKVPINASTSYYLSYRRGVGMDATYLGSHHWDRTHIIKASGLGVQTYFLGTLGDGETFTDSEAGISVTQLAHSDYAANIRVEILPDVTPPTTPGNFLAALATKTTKLGRGKRATITTTTTVQLSWSASSDSKGIASYEIFRNDVKIGTVSGTAHVDSGTIAGGGVYNYYVIATDNSGNRSAASNVSTVTR